MTNMDLYLDEHHVMLRDMVREFAETEIAPVAAELDEAEAFPWENGAKMAELGLFGIPFPEEYGGAAMDLLSSVIAVEELARIDASHSIMIATGSTARPFMTCVARTGWSSSFSLRVNAVSSGAPSLSS